MDNTTAATSAPSSKREWLVFSIISIVLFPLLTIVGVLGFGFVVWILQAIFGPPGHG